MYELDWDGTEVTDLLTVDYEGDATRGVFYYDHGGVGGAQSETLLFLPSIRRETGIIIGGNADGTINDETEGVIVDSSIGPGDPLHPGVYAVTSHDAAGTTGVCITPDPFATDRTPDNFPNDGNMPPSGWNELNMMSLGFGTGGGAMTDHLTVVSAGPGVAMAGSSVDHERSSDGKGLSGGGSCACRCAAANEPLSSVAHYDPSLGAMVDGIGDNGMDNHSGIMFCGEDLKIPTGLKTDDQTGEEVVYDPKTGKLGTGSGNTNDDIQKKIQDMTGSPADKVEGMTSCRQPNPDRARPRRSKSAGPRESGPDYRIAIGYEIYETKGGGRLWVRSIEVEPVQLGWGGLGKALGAVLRALKLFRSTKAAQALAKQLKFTATTTAHMGSKARRVPRYILAQAIRIGKRSPDPQGAAGAIKIEQAIFKNGKLYMLEIIYNPKTKTILHFVYKA